MDAIVLGSVAIALLAGCAAATVRSQPAGEDQRPVGVVHLVWRTTVHQHGLFEPRPEECATGAVVGTRLVIGSRAASIVGVDTDNGKIAWATPTSGGIDSEARLDPVQGHVYVGADDGTIYAVDPASGALRWNYKSRGAIERPPEIGTDGIYVSTAADRIFSLDGKTGRWRWQYEREGREGFSIHGHAGPRLHGDEVLTGFSDGFVVSLSRGTGEVVWARSMAAVSDQFVDVDSTPTLDAGIAYVSSYSGGLYALDARDGTVRWRVGIEGAGTLRVAGTELYFAAPREGLHAMDREGHVLWRQGLTDAGDLTTPLVVGQYLVFSGSRAGLFVIDRGTGRLLQTFNPGRGICGGAVMDPNGTRLYVLSNGGSLYALELG